MLTPDYHSDASHALEIIFAEPFSSDVLLPSAAAAPTPCQPALLLRQRPKRAQRRGRHKMIHAAGYADSAADAAAFDAKDIDADVTCCMARHVLPLI